MALSGVMLPSFSTFSNQREKTWETVSYLFALFFIPTTLDVCDSFAQWMLWVKQVKVLKKFSLCKNLNTHFV